MTEAVLVALLLFGLSEILGILQMAQLADEKAETLKEGEDDVLVHDEKGTKVICWTLCSLSHLYCKFLLLCD